MKGRGRLLVAAAAAAAGIIKQLIWMEGRVPTLQVREGDLHTSATKTASKCVRRCTYVQGRKHSTRVWADSFGKGYFAPMAAFVFLNHLNLHPAGCSEAVWCTLYVVR